MKYIGLRNNKPYCRKCIAFRGQEATDEYIPWDIAPYSLNYELSDDQKRLSNQLVENYKNGIDSLVYAVCGSGKTEICLEIIRYCIESGLRVGFAVPRKDVCVELFYRYNEIFKENIITAVYGGHAKYIEGDLVVLTTHQLFRYEHYFDLLIMDEIDAFPFKGSDILKAFFLRSIKKNFVLLTATPSDELLNYFKKPGKAVLELFTRFHGHPLPVPRVIKGNSIYLNYKLIKETGRFLKSFKQVFIFVPTIDLSIKLYRFLALFYPGGHYINSKCEDREEIIKSFRLKKYLQVIVYRADHPIYDSYSLIQIAGRVGRKKDAPEGEVIYLARENNKDIKRAVEEISAANKKVQNLL